MGATVAALTGQIYHLGTAIMFKDWLSLNGAAG
jgi:hypothetical protein